MMDALTRWLTPEHAMATLRAIWAWLLNDAFVPSTLAQLGVAVLALLVARLVAPRVGRAIRRMVTRWQTDPRLIRAAAVLSGLSLPLIWLVLDWLAMAIAERAGLPYQLMRVVATLLAAWIVIRLSSRLISDPFWSQVVAVIAWTIAALSIVGLLDETTAILNSVALSIGSMRLSLLTVIKAAAVLVLLLWVANWTSGVFDRRVQAATTLAPSVQLLFSKLFKIALFAIAVLMGLGAVGIDVTALAVFTGAVGVGIGFGLQAIINNFVAGIILLIERSLKIGDFVELASGVRGEVRYINIRNTIITTNDNIDIIVPNSEFVNGTVTNWTFGDAYRRMRIPFGVAYGSDKELVRKAGLEAAAAVEHTLNGDPRRKPQVWLVGFGDSALNFELVVWITPPAVKRPGAVNAAYCWALETALTRHGIEIPFPQRDIHLKDASVLKILKAGERRDDAAEA